MTFMTTLHVYPQSLRILGSLFLCAGFAVSAQSLSPAPQPPEVNPLPMESIPDFLCVDVSPWQVNGLDTTFTWSDRLKRLDVTDAWDASYKAYAVRGDTGLQIQEFSVSGLHGKDDKSVQTLKSDPTGMSIHAKLFKRTKFSRDVDAATVWFSVTRSHMPLSNTAKHSWIATAFLRINQNELLEASPGKEVSKMTFVLQCKFLNAEQRALKDISDREREEDERMEALIRGDR
jgi:hypothetical protein